MLHAWRGPGRARRSRAPGFVLCLASLLPALTGTASLDVGSLRDTEEARALALSGDLTGAQALCDDVLRAAGSAHAVRLAHVASADVPAALRARRDIAPLWLMSSPGGGFDLLWGYFASAEDAQAAAARVPKGMADGPPAIVDLKAPLGAPGPATTPVAAMPAPVPAPVPAAQPAAVQHAPPAAGAVKPPSSSAASAADLFQRGNEAVSHADYPAAITAFQQSLLLDPDNPRTLSNLGTALYLGGDPAKAEGVFRQAIALDATYARAHLNLGSALYALERLDEAHAEIQRAIDLDPTNVDARHNLAALLVEQRRWSEALRVLDAALAIAPDDERLRRQREQVQAQLDVRLAQPAADGTPEDSELPPTDTVADTTPAISAGPCTDATSQAARSRLAAKLLAEGRAAYERHQLAAAEVALERAQECDPASTAILNHVGAVRMATHDYSRAEAAFRLAHSLEPAQLEATVNLALAIFEGGRCEEALALLQDAAKAHPDSGEAAFQLARVLHRCGHPQEAGVELARATKLLPGDPRVARLAERLAATTSP